MQKQVTGHKNETLFTERKFRFDTIFGYWICKASALCTHDMYLEIELTIRQKGIALFHRRELSSKQVLLTGGFMEDIRYC